MDLLRKPKIEELRTAIQNRLSQLIVVYGPPGSLKTTAITEICSQFGLCLEYVADISNYKNKLLSKDSICYTDIDSQEFITRHKHKLEKMKNLIIETRSFHNIWKHLKNCKVVEFRKITNTTIKKLIKTVESGESLEETLEIIDGNLHRLPFYKYCSKIENIDIYRYLGRLFYSKNISDKSFSSFKITNYLFSNAISFFDGSDLYEVYEGFSLTDTRLQEFYEYSEYLVFSKKKKNTGRHTFKSLNVDDFHMCSSFCEQFKHSK